MSFTLYLLFLNMPQRFFRFFFFISKTTYLCDNFLLKWHHYSSVLFYFQKIFFLVKVTRKTNYIFLRNHTFCFMVLEIFSESDLIEIFISLQNQFIKVLIWLGKKVWRFRKFNFFTQIVNEEKIYFVLTVTKLKINHPHPSP